MHDYALDALRADRETILKIGAVRISATRAAGRTFQVGPGDPVAEVSSTAPALVRWITQRGDWEELGVTACGDERQLCLAAQLKVF